MNKTIKPNRYKSESDEESALRFDSNAGVDFCLKCIMTVAFISLLSLSSIFIYDFITQSNYFNIKKIEVSGTKQVPEQEILELADVGCDKNIFKLNLFIIEKLIAAHPWVQSASVKRDLSFTLTISIVEEQPLAIVKIENLADILINTQGLPFKEYDPLTDHLENIPVITGLDLTRNDNHYMFNGILFDSIMNFLKTEDFPFVHQIDGNQHTGISVETTDIYNRLPEEAQETLHIRLGFGDYKEKMKKAKKLSEYIDKNFPEKTICSMDLFNLNKVFIKTKLNTALHNNLEKGV